MSTAGPAHRVQSATVEYGFPQGHLGHLSPDEEAAFEKFKKLCEEKGYYKPGNGAEEIGTHDDPTLLRFLRARRFMVQDAFKQFQETEDWRKANQLDQLYSTIDIEHYDETRKLYPTWTGRRDRRGIPIYVYEVKHLNAKTMAAYEKSAAQTKSQADMKGQTPAKLLRLFALYENLTRFVMPLCTALTDRPYPNTPITQSNNIVDITGVGLKQFWNLRGHMQDASTLATAHYPETLDRIFIIGAPAFFPTVWGWIKKWFDPITTSKIFIISSSEVKKTLEAFIDPANIPKKYGGKLDYKFGDMPALDPAVAKLITWDGTHHDFPHGPMYWIPKVSEGTMDAIAVGAIHEKLRNEKIGTFKREIHDESSTAQQDDTNLTVQLSRPYSNDELPEGVQPQPPIGLEDDDSTPADTESPTPVEEPFVQQGEVVSAGMPEIKHFVTADEGVEAKDEANGAMESQKEAVEQKTLVTDRKENKKDDTSLRKEISNESSSRRPRSGSDAAAIATAATGTGAGAPRKSIDIKEKAGKVKGKVLSGLVGKVKDKVHS